MCALAALSVPGCATLSTSGMTPACRTYYNACLDTCPRPARGPNADMPPRANGERSYPQQGFDLDASIAACVEQCNEQGRRCE